MSYGAKPAILSGRAGAYERHDAEAHCSRLLPPLTLTDSLYLKSVSLASLHVSFTTRYVKKDLPSRTMILEKTQSSDVDDQGRFPRANGSAEVVELKEANKAHATCVMESGVHEHVCLLSLHAPKLPSLRSLASNSQR